MKILHIYTVTCEYAYPSFPAEKITTDAFDEEIMVNTDLEVRYLAGLKELGEDCILFYPREYKLPIKEFIHKRGYRIKRFPVTFSLGSVRYPLKMLWHILKEKPDIIHIHSIYQGGRFFHIRFLNIIALFAKLIRTPVCGWYHIGNFLPAKHIVRLGKKLPLVRKVDRYFRELSLNNLDGITSINNPEMERLFNPQYNEFYGHKLKTPFRMVTPNTFDSKDFYYYPKQLAKEEVGLNQNVRYIIMVSRLFKSKGLHDLISAYFELNKRYKDLHLIVVGDYVQGAESYKVEIENLIKAFNLENDISFLGRLEHHQGLLKYIASADVFVLPTYKESFGAANIEAIACKIPVISTNIEEIPYYLKPGLGFTFEPGNIKQLESALEKVLTGKFILDDLEYERFLGKYEYLSSSRKLRDWYREIIQSKT
ncbi:MAG: glycosyltransferase [bacterium]